jgi:hypothetical protein
MKIEDIANRFLKESPEESIEPSLKKYIDEVGIEKVLRIISKAYSGTIEKPNEILKIINNAVKDIEFAKLN